MEDNVNIISKQLKIGIAVAAILAVTAASGAARNENETIDAHAYGTSTQLGKNFTVRLIIYEYSTAEDRKILIDSFAKGQNDGLANALEKMKAVGRITIPGTLGFDVSYIREIKTPTGRSIRFITNRQIAFGESYYSTESKSFNLTAGEIRINTQDNDKSDGVLYPATQLTINKDGEPQWDLRMNPWKLNNIKDWTNGTGKDK
jgi:glycerophosphoryl diester phosphodiesterase